jgi:hypothetical protein
MGDNCELQYDVCGLVPCKNNGTCMGSPNRRDYRCRCPLGRVIKECGASSDLSALVFVSIVLLLLVAGKTFCMVLYFRNEGQ